MRAAALAQKSLRQQNFESCFGLRYTAEQCKKGLV
jgi:hypothetical protein